MWLVLFLLLVLVLLGYVLMQFQPIISLKLASRRADKAMEKVDEILKNIK